ncbi:Peptidase S24/S26A/S26B, conserved region [Desulfovibrio sp. X2]|uniref:LexA family protein n=1 Tax=Desulfovibrio sp. X2 TaxID=941449 RepID=UPI000358B92B|nr:translesion error-prone DNA polymerase V autoproteolytic subunit [Desulfovibrio sp. X2]EPR44311.1 Peptidase S24/S26A/S26B, conserved region [Desulfovibrio sp. X2]
MPHATIEILGVVPTSGPSSGPSFGSSNGQDAGLPLYLAQVPAGFPSPAEDYIDRRLDLNEHLVKNPAATFFVRVSGDSMRDAGITSGDILVVDRSLEPRDGAVVVAALDGELTVKRLRTRRGRLYLMPDNPDYAPVEIDPEASFTVWGVVTFVIHKA